LGMLSLTTWDGMGHSIMREWLPGLSTQGKSGILSGKGGQGRARSNVAPECPPGQQSRTRAVDGTLIQRSRTVRRSLFPFKEV
jgi:hypothetical protein